MKRRAFIKTAAGLLVPSALGQGFLSRRTGAVAYPAAASAAAPSFTAEVATWNSIVDDGTANHVVTLTSGQSVAAGSYAVAAVNRYVSARTLNSVSDSVNGSWTKAVDLAFDTSSRLSIWYKLCASALAPGDTITIAMSSTGATYCFGSLCSIANAATSGQPDQYTSASQVYAQTVSAPASTTASNTVLFGTLMSGGATYGSGSWDAISNTTVSSWRAYYFKKAVSSSGSQNPGGSLSAYDTWGAVWAAFK